MNKKNILFITPQAFSNTNERASSILRILSKKYDVHPLIVPCFDGQSTIQRATRMMYILPKFYFNAIKYIYFKKIDIIFCELIELGFIGASLSILTRKICIWDLHRNTLNLCDELRKSKIQKWIYLNLEKMLWVFIRKVFVISDSEKQAYIRQGFDTSKIKVIPISADFNLIKDINSNQTELKNKLNLNKKTILFFGFLDYPPNKIAVNWINSSLAPAIYEKFKNDVVILIAGRGEILKKSHRIVDFVGFVPNIFEYIYASDIVIAPIWGGEGQLTKLIDSMMCSKLTIVSEISSIGIPQLMDGFNTIIARNQDEFIRKTLTSLETIESMSKICIHARKTIETYYNWDIWEQKLFEEIEKQISKVEI